MSECRSDTVVDERERRGADEVASIGSGIPCTNIYTQHTRTTSASFTSQQ